MATAHLIWLSVFVTAAFIFVLVECTHDFCRLPSETGRCRAAIRRYFYDVESGQCRQFIYGGCDGNANNFATSLDCQAACRCTLPLDSGDRTCNARPRRQYFYNTATGSCARFRYAGCGGNSNRFWSPRQCRSSCALSKCYLPAETGVCKAYIRRYYYNSQIGACQTFVYGGCQGNSNNFASKQACDQQCASRLSTPQQPPPPLPTPSPSSGGSNSGNANGGQTDSSGNLQPDCELPKVVGVCRAAFPRFYYNKAAARCERFIYGGCRGNANNFKTLSDCQKRCGGTNQTGRGRNRSGSSVASLAGEDRGRITNGRSIRSTAEPSSVSDPTQVPVRDEVIFAKPIRNVLAMDANIFDTPVRAMNRKTEDICELPAVSGPCFAYVQSFAFNWSTGRCVSFVYGGCQGNSNRFPDMPSCLRRCQKPWSERFSSRSRQGFSVEGSIIGGGLRDGRTSSISETSPTPVKIRFQPSLSNRTRLSFNFGPRLPQNVFTSKIGEDQARFRRGRITDRISEITRKDSSKNTDGGNDLMNTRSRNRERLVSEALTAFKQALSPIEGQPYLRQVCGRGKDAGRCWYRLPMYYFDTETLTCEQFFYSGCGGNGNVYRTVEECRRTCLRSDHNEEGSSLG